MSYHIKLPGDQYTAWQYPGGESQVRLTERCGAEVQMAKHVTIDARLYSSLQIMELVLLVDAVRGVNRGHWMEPGSMPITLNLPYLPYARADRRFVQGDCHGLKAFAGVINGLKFDKVRVLDVHSSAASVIDRLEDIRPEAAIQRVIGDLFGYGFDGTDGYGDQSKPTIMFPDEGAKKRYSWVKVPRGVDVKYCNKVRDAVTGKLSSFQVPASEDVQGPVLIIDDICDGGGTFVGIADALRLAGWHEKPSLYVTHGIFSKGLYELHSRFGSVFTTDSVVVRELPGFVKVEDAFGLLG